MPLAADGGTQQLQLMPQTQVPTAEPPLNNAEMAFEWSDHGDVCLIEEVRKYPWLYNSRHPSYKDQDRKRDSWMKISELFGSTNVSGDELEHRWNLLRDRYRRARKIQTATGSDGQDVDRVRPKWPLYDIMHNFMDQHTSHRNWIGRSFSVTEQDAPDGQSDDSRSRDPPEHAQKTADWSEQNDACLILQVEKHPLLYNSRHPSYKDKDKRRDSWIEISKVFGLVLSGDELEHRWNILRDRYRRARKIQTVTGSDSQDVDRIRPKWALYDMMNNFMDQHTSHRNRSSIRSEGRLADIYPEDPPEGAQQTDDWSEQADERLVRLVQKYPWLYKSIHRKDRKNKNKSWLEISRLFGSSRSRDELEHRLRILRDRYWRYRRILNATDLDSQDLEHTRPKWALYDVMDSFMHMLPNRIPRLNRSSGSLSATETHGPDAQSDDELVEGCWEDTKMSSGSFSATEADAPDTPDGPSDDQLIEGCSGDTKMSDDGFFVTETDAPDVQSDDQLAESCSGDTKIGLDSFFVTETDSPATRSDNQPVASCSTDTKTDGGSVSASRTIWVAVPKSLKNSRLGASFPESTKKSQDAPGPGTPGSPDTFSVLDMDDPQWEPPTDVDIATRNGLQTRRSARLSVAAVRSLGEDEGVSGRSRRLAIRRGHSPGDSSRSRSRSPLSSREHREAAVRRKHSPGEAQQENSAREQPRKSVDRIGAFGEYLTHLMRLVPEERVTEMEMELQEVVRRFSC